MPPTVIADEGFGTCRMRSIQANFSMFAYWLEFSPFVEYDNTDDLDTDGDSTPLSSPSNLPDDARDRPMFDASREEDGVESSTSSLYRMLYLYKDNGVNGLGEQRLRSRALGIIYTNWHYWVSYQSTRLFSPGQRWNGFAMMWPPEASALWLTSITWNSALILCDTLACTEIPPWLHCFCIISKLYPGTRMLLPRRLCNNRGLVFVINIYVYPNKIYIQTANSPRSTPRSIEAGNVTV